MDAGDPFSSRRLYTALRVITSRHFTRLRHWMLDVGCWMLDVGCRMFVLAFPVVIPVPPPSASPGFGGCPGDPGPGPRLCPPVPPRLLAGCKSWDWPATP